MSHPRRPCRDCTTYATVPQAYAERHTFQLPWLPSDKPAGVYIGGGRGAGVVPCLRVRASSVTAPPGLPSFWFSFSGSFAEVACAVSFLPAVETWRRRPLATPPPRSAMRAVRVRSGGLPRCLPVRAAARPTTRSTRDQAMSCGSGIGSAGGVVHARPAQAGVASPGGGWERGASVV